MAKKESYEVAITKTSLCEDWHWDEDTEDEDFQYRVGSEEEEILLQTKNLEEAKHFFEDSKGMKVPFENLDNNLDVVEVVLRSISQDEDQNVLDSEIINDFVPFKLWD